MNDVPVIVPNAIYTLATAAPLFGARRNTLPRYCRQGKLRYAKRGGKVLILGAWLIEFIERGEVKRTPRLAAVDRAA